MLVSTEPEHFLCIKHVIYYSPWINHTLLFFCCFTVSAKFLYNTDLHVFDNPSEETEQFIYGVTLLFESIGKLGFEPPLYKIYPNKLYRDFKKALAVILLLVGRKDSILA